MIALLAALAFQCPDGSPPPCARPGAPLPARAPDPQGVTVLYFANASGDTADAPLAEGLTEEIIARLSRVPGLHPASRYASARYRGRRALDPVQAGRELATRYVLEGTLRRAATRVRLVLAMTDVTRGFNVWGQTFERPVGEFFSIEDSVAVQVAQVVLGRPATSMERVVLAPVAASTSSEAHQANLRGRVAIRRRTAAAASEAVASFSRALAADPRYARAWSGLAHALSLARDWGWPITGVGADSIQPLAEQAAARALALDSADVESWLAGAMAERPRNIARALAMHRRAVAMDSSDVEAVHQLAWVHFVAADLDSAIYWERQAIARDPFFAYAYAGLGAMLGTAGRPEEVLAVVAQGQAVDSNNAPLYWQAADANLRLGRWDAGRAAADRAEALGFDPLGARILRTVAMLGRGDTAAVRAALPVLEREVSASPQAAGGQAFSLAGLMSGLYGQLGDAPGAVRWAGAVAPWPRRLYAIMFARHWLWAPVRNDPRFQAFLRSLQS